MNRKKRTVILLKGSFNVVTKLAQEVLRKYNVTTIKEPNSGLVMIKVRETSKKSLFYLGEVFVTECKVLINSCLGIGIVKGQEPDLAYYLAIIDAAYNAYLPEWIRYLKSTPDWYPEKSSS